MVAASPAEREVILRIGALSYRFPRSVILAEIPDNMVVDNQLPYREAIAIREKK